MSFLTPGRTFVIAEVAQAHDGSLGTAHAYIDAAARAGADAVKFQTHIADAESSPEEPWRVAFSKQDASRFEYWKRMEFTEEQWQGLADHARGVGLAFLSSPFSVEAVDLLTKVGVPAWKVASGEVTNPLLMERILATKLPVLISTGMSTNAEIDAAVATCRDAGIEFAVMQCTSAYPTPPERVGLNLLADFRERYGCPVGLSDHSGTVYAGLAAASLGAAVIEVHVTFSRETFGPDVASSVTVDELADLVAGVRFIEAAVGGAVDKDAAAAGFDVMRRTFTKGLAARRALPAGTVVSMHDLVARKPCNGIPAARMRDVVGRSVQRDVAAGAWLVAADVGLADESESAKHEEATAQHDER